jgi:hypothetical protein
MGGCLGFCDAYWPSEGVPAQGLCPGWEAKGVTDVAAHAVVCVEQAGREWWWGVGVMQGKEGGHIRALVCCARHCGPSRCRSPRGWM